ncbi:uncharacterized protein BDV17DRAFT_290337 [Aspergillus undulatus]|uniref:uncharacterized protein n=1 Tax=Aspergillus undulatus TaxID=1810928 RepID=UPI003CCC991A
MPKRRSNLAVPDITEDAAERKRILNVLAQRRYRKRKKDLLQSLQKQIGRQGKTAEGAEGSSNSEPLHFPRVGIPLSAIDPDFISRSTEPLLDQDIDATEPFQDSFNAPLPDIARPPSPEFQFLSFLSTPDFFIPQIPDNNPFVNPSSLALQPSSDANRNDEDQLLNLPNPTFANDTTAADLSDHLQTSESALFTFPDDSILEVPRMKLFNAAMVVALRLGIADTLWELSAVSPFYKSNPAGKATCLALNSSSSSSSASASSLFPEWASLPVHLRPTPSQLLLPHHPMLDILPWPSTRDKLIQIFNFPPHLRPQAARDPIGMLRLAYDMEDEGGEGMRIAGEDVFEPDGWEIGQLVFERWWWAFEGDVVERCDRARRRRGEVGLVLGVVG